jgi:hypothetical protein
MENKGYLWYNKVKKFQMNSFLAIVDGRFVVLISLSGKFIKSFFALKLKNLMLLKVIFMEKQTKVQCKINNK